MKKLLRLLPCLFAFSIAHADVHVHTQMTATDLPQGSSWEAQQTWNVNDPAVLDGSSEWARVIFGDYEGQVLLVISGRQVKIVLMQNNPDTDSWDVEEEVVYETSPGQPLGIDLSSESVEVQVVILID